MDKLISVVIKLQEIAVKSNIPFDIKLPQIVVIGAQNSGKTSILELIIGKDLLPHNTIIPIILKLNKSDEEYAILKHKRFTDFNQLKEEIRSHMDYLMSQESFNESVNVELYSPQVLDVTLIDLPGLIKIPVGNQPKSIIKKIRKIVKGYIEDTCSLILAVSPANIDIANSDALQLAREVDIEGKRTLGVITKLDLVDNKSDVIRVIQGKEYPLPLGYVGVVCRSQEDVKEGKSLKQALEDEKELINNSAYNTIKDLCGINSLTKKLSQILIQDISEKLPLLKSCIESQLRIHREELVNYGISLADSCEACHSQLLFLISKYSEYYHASLEGNSKVNQADEYKSGARIHILIQEGYVKDLHNINPFDTLTDEVIRTEIFNSKALKPGIFIPEEAFEALAKQQIKRLLGPSMQCADHVYTELMNVAINPVVTELASFDKVKRKIAEIMKELLKTYLEPTKEMINDLIEVESSHININHPDVLAGSSTVLTSLRNRPHPYRPKKKSQLLSTKAIAEPTMKELIELEITKSLIIAYFKVVVTRVADVIPKTIMSFLVNKSLYEVHDTLIHRIMMEKDWVDLLEEDPLVVEKRNECRKAVENLTNSKKIVNELLGI